MNDFYTYFHTRNDTGAVFYVGKGRGERAEKINGRNKHWRNVVEKAGRTVHIAMRALSEHDAHEHEKFLIGCFRSLGVTLANATDGGEGVSGLVFSDASRKRMSDAQLARFKRPEELARCAEVMKRSRHNINLAMKSPAVRAKMRAIHTTPEMLAMHKAALSSEEANAKRNLAMKSEETRAKMRAAMAKRPPASEETRAKMSAALKGRTFTTEAKEKLRAAALADWAKRKAATA